MLDVSLTNGLPPTASFTGCGFGIFPDEESSPKHAVADYASASEKTIRLPRFGFSLPRKKLGGGGGQLFNVLVQLIDNFLTFLLVGGCGVFGSPVECFCQCGSQLVLRRR